MNKNESRETEREDNGFPLRTANLVLVTLAVLFSVNIIIETFRTNRSYESLREDTEAYIELQHSAADMRDASYYLTNAVRMYTMTDDLSYVDDFFEEVEVTKRRDRALETVRKESDNQRLVESLVAAMNYSNELLEREIYAMRLMLDTRMTALSDYPRIAAVELSDIHAGLSAERKIEIAQSMVFDKTYQGLMDKVLENTDACMESLLEMTRAQEQKSADELYSRLKWQQVLIAAALLTFVIAVVLTSLMIISPVNNSVKHLKKQEFIPVKGSREMQILAKSYNKMFEESRLKHEKLSYEAAHDPLTRLNNRGVFEAVCAEPFSEGMAIIALDIDDFKGINDTYGHDVGDAILKKLSALLKSQFRSDDCVCRIGGDEFVIVMYNVSEETTPLIESKIRHIEEELGKEDRKAGVPKASISAGVAFGSEQIVCEELYKRADTALYRVKNGEKGSFAVY